jgi:ribonuclease BN (tRNA processing enzyme)
MSPHPDKPQCLRMPALAMGLLCAQAFAGSAAGEVCGAHGVAVQVLGSGGPELRGGRASTSYVVWREGRAVVLIDAGGGSALRFGESGARFHDLHAVLFTHLHADHNADFPALVKSSFFEGRDADLPVFGPGGNALLPATDRSLELLFGEQGVYPYLHDMLDGSAGWKLVPRVVSPEGQSLWSMDLPGNLSIAAVRVEHGPLPALAWRVDIGGLSVAFSGDMNGRLGTLERLAADADLLVAHHAIGEADDDSVARRLHMPPSEIGRIAAEAKVHRVVLTHLMKRSELDPEANLAALRKRYDGPVDVATDLACYPLVAGGT